MTTTTDIRRALETHYLGANGASEEWVLIHEARRGPGFSGNDGAIDLLAINTWESRGLRRVAHEIKVSRNDWQRELKNPGKADWIWKITHQFFLVVPAPWAKIVHEEELPAAWGLLEVTEAGKVRVVEKCPKHDPLHPTMGQMTGWLAQVDRFGKRNSVAELEAARAEGRRTGREEAMARDRDEQAIERARLLSQQVMEFERATGIGIREAAAAPNGADARRLRAMYRMCGTWNGMDARNRLGAAQGSLNRLIESIGQVLEDLGPIVPEDPDV